jgi:[acyl-carrier-protein] S-malonyltransferase
MVRRYAYLFPGQGSQFSGMGQALAESYPASGEVFELADRALEVPISRICFQGSEEELALTENTQPAVLTVGVAAMRALESKGLRPAAVAGHSLGEYGALVAAGTLDAEAAIRAVRLRGRFMQQAVPVGEGAMAAILGLDPRRVAEICLAAAQGEVVSPANLNGPSQVVIAGAAAAVERAILAAKEAGAKRAVPLRVSAPFHCELMRPAADALSPVLDATEFRDPSVPIYCNVDAKPIASGSAAREALVRQVVSPVRWQEQIEAMLRDGIETFVEVGPGKVLAGLVRAIRRDVRVLPAGDPTGVEAAAMELANS